MTSINYDYLTGLYNRQGMYDIWNSIITRDKYVQVLFVDLDNFKLVNDIYGHKVGDRTLIKTSEILKRNVEKTDAVIRLGGDEFVILRTGKVERDELSELADNLRTSMSRQATSDKAFEVISLSIGIVWNGEVSEKIDQLLSYSDAAMYYAKELGKNNYVFFDDYAEQIKTAAEMESTAEIALENGCFKLKYYPVQHLQNVKLLRTVAMTIWERQDGSCWNQDDFEKVLEKSGFLKRIDMYSIEALCRDYRHLVDVIGEESRISIRLSYLLLEDDVVSTLINLATTYGVSCEKIEILVSGRLFSERNKVRLVRNISLLSKAGFCIGLTDFGGDFSSFKVLETIPFSAVFFDRDYLDECIKNNKETGVLSTLFNLTSDLHLLSVACYVRDTKTAEYMIKCGCIAAAGEYFSKALDLWEFKKYIAGIRKHENVYLYDFKDGLKTTDGSYEGEIVGGGIQFVQGISDNWGGLRFDGGPIETNLLRLPGILLPGGSYSITMWVKPAEVQNWTSAFFVRQQDGFISFMPSVSGNLCMFRMHPDGDVPWTDNMSNALPIGKWTFVALVYDSFSNTIRLFLDGKFVKMRSDIQDMGSSSFVYLGGDCYQLSYKGEISAFGIYDIPLTGEEIKKKYEEFRKEENFRGDDEPEEMVEYMVHDPAIYEDMVTNKYYIYSTGADSMVSDDMMRWKNLGKVVKEVPQEAQDWTGSDMIWAPDIVKVGKEYRLYCSNSSWGVQQSCIFLATSNSAGGPFVPKAVVLKTDDTLTVNGIDANIIEDHRTGEQYMLYGSFWGGVHLLPLDKETGLARDAGPDGSGVGSLRLLKDYKEGMHISEMPQAVQETRMGKCLARRPEWMSGSIEGPYMIYDADTDYYYLFVSYGSLKSDYNIRVGRSRSVSGPFVDYNGRDMVSLDDVDNSVGLNIAAGYRWLTGMPYMAPGHNSVIKTSEGDMFLVSHIRKMRFLEKDPGVGLLQIRRLFMTPDGWPILSSQQYARETFRIARLPVIPGLYERLELRPSIPQGIAHAHPLKLYKDGRLECCSVVGSWKVVDEYTLEFKYGPITEYIHVEKGLDHDNNKTTVLLSGLTSQGICTWAKKNLDYKLEE